MAIDVKSFWGGYKVEFKLVTKDVYALHRDDIEKLRKYSLELGDEQTKKYFVDISKHEFCSGKQKLDLDGYTVFLF